MASERKNDKTPKSVGGYCTSARNTGMKYNSISCVYKYRYIHIKFILDGFLIIQESFSTGNCIFQKTNSHGAFLSVSIHPDFPLWSMYVAGAAKELFQSLKALSQKRFFPSAGWNGSMDIHEVPMVSWWFLG